MTTTNGVLQMRMPVSALGRQMGRTTVYDGSGRQSVAVAVEPLTSGLRALVLIDSPSDPERVDFELSDDVARLEPDAGGGVTAYAADGDVVAVVGAPWARDSAGAPVPTHFEVNGLTLTQVVEHRGGAGRYPIVADPSIWAVSKCAAAIAWVVSSNVFAAAKIVKLKAAIKALGGVREAARLLLGATTKTEKIRVLAKAGAAGAAYILGIDTVINNC